MLPLVNAALNWIPTSILAGRCPIQVFNGRDPGPPLDVMFRPDVPQIVDVRLDPSNAPRVVYRVYRRLYRKFTAANSSLILPREEKLSLCQILFLLRLVPQLWNAA